MIAKLAEIAATQVGVKEVGGNNCGKKIREYQSATNLAPGVWPWCSAFMCWILQQWGKDKDAAAWLNLRTTTMGTWRPKTASAFGLIEWANKRPNTTTIYPETALPQAGDLVIFDFSHCGVVTGTRSAQILTVEGNTNGAGDRDSTTGDGVWAKIRSKSLVRCYIRIHPSTAK